jgi:spermidine synthase
MISLAEMDHEFGAIRVYRDKRTGDLTFLQGGCFQTKTDRNGVSLVTYVHALFGLVMQAKAQRILMVGCGGGSLASMLATAGKRLVVVDVNPAAIEIASRHFNLPDSVECHVDDGAEFLKSECGEFDAIIMDAYCGDRIPDHLRSTQFFRLSKSRLARPHGCFLANVHMIDDADPAAHDYGHAALEVWRNVRILDAPRAMYRNAIVAAGAVNGLRPPALMMSPATEAAALAEELARARFLDVALGADHPPEGNR